MKTRYRIKKTKDGYSVWTLKNFGEGYAWVDTGKRYSSSTQKEESKKNEAQTFGCDCRDTDNGLHVPAIVGNLTAKKASRYGFLENRRSCTLYPRV